MNEYKNTYYIPNNNLYGLLRVDGLQTRNFLQGQLTADLQELQPNKPLWAAYCNIKGRLVAWLRVYNVNDKIYLRLPLSLLNNIQQELQKYALLSKITITNISNEIITISLIGKNACLIADNYSTLWLDKIKKPIERCQLYIPKNNNKAIHVDAIQTNENSWQLAEIRSYIPEIYPATQNIFLPHYLNLPQLNAVSFIKGCYRGQEIISKMEYRGNIKRSLYYAKITNCPKLLPGQAISSVNEPNKIVGKIVRAAFNSSNIIEFLAELDNSYKTKQLCLHKQPELIFTMEKCFS